MQKNHTTTSRYGGIAPLAMWMAKHQVWQQIEQEVVIKQKTVIHTPHEKLQDAFIHTLTGRERLHTINSGIRADRGIQRLFGRSSCAEQSSVSTTLNRCDEESVSGMKKVLANLLRQHGQTAKHNYQSSYLCLDIDLSGMICGREAEGGEKGYYVKKRGKRGRQLGRVTSQYDEIVYEHLFSGKRQLEKSLQGLVDQSAQALKLTQKQISRTVIRVDAGGGTEANITQLQQKGYSILMKGHSWTRNKRLAQTVETWLSDPERTEREFGLVTQPVSYEKETVQVAIRKQKENGKWSYSVIVSDLPHRELCNLARIPYRKNPADWEVCQAVLNGYDKRGAGVETTFKNSKTGLGIGKRNKKIFTAQEMLFLLAQLAHNMIIWVAAALRGTAKKYAHFGVLRIIRDMFHISAKISWHEEGSIQINSITLNKRHPHAKHWARFSANFLILSSSPFNLGEI